MTITKIKISGFEEPFVIETGQALRKWQQELKMLRDEAEKLQGLARQIFEQQHWANEVNREPIAVHIETPVVVS
jgi:hypothetical protein